MLIALYIAGLVILFLVDVGLSHENSKQKKMAVQDAATINNQTAIIRNLREGVTVRDHAIESWRETKDLLQRDYDGIYACFCRLARAALRSPNTLFDRDVTDRAEKEIKEAYAAREAWVGREARIETRRMQCFGDLENIEAILSDKPLPYPRRIGDHPAIERAYGAQDCVTEIAKIVGFEDPHDVKSDKVVDAVKKLEIDHGCARIQENNFRDLSNNTVAENEDLREKVETLVEKYQKANECARQEIQKSSRLTNVLRDVKVFLIDGPYDTDAFITRAGALQALVASALDEEVVLPLKWYAKGGDLDSLAKKCFDEMPFESPGIKRIGSKLPGASQGTLAEAARKLRETVVANLRKDISGEYLRRELGRGNSRSRKTEQRVYPYPNTNLCRRASDKAIIARDQHRQHDEAVAMWGGWFFDAE